jgi:hypothetical protein
MNDFLAILAGVSLAIVLSLGVTVLAVCAAYPFVIVEDVGTNTPGPTKSTEPSAVAGAELEGKHENDL